MRKALRIITISAGIVSAVSAIVLGCIYLEDIAGYIKRIKEKIFARINEAKYIGEDFERE